MYFDQILDFPILLLLFLNTLLLCHILLFGCRIFSIPSGCQTVWIQIRPDVLSGLIWVQTVCKGYRSPQKLSLAGKELNTKQLFDTTFWLKPWLKLIWLGSNFFHLAKCWLQQILSQGKPCVRLFSFGFFCLSVTWDMGRGFKEKCAYVITMLRNTKLVKTIATWNARWKILIRPAAQLVRWSLHVNIRLALTLSLCFNTHARAF